MRFLSTLRNWSWNNHRSDVVEMGNVGVQDFFQACFCRNANDCHFHQVACWNQVRTDFSTRRKWIVSDFFFWQESISFITRSEHGNETQNMHHFCNFLWVQVIWFQTDFWAANGILQDNWPIISHGATLRPCIWWKHHGVQQEPLGRRILE
jgi:hypothetical protein